MPESTLYEGDTQTLKRIFYSALAIELVVVPVVALMGFLLLVPVTFFISVITAVILLRIFLTPLKVVRVDTKLRIDCLYLSFELVPNTVRDFKMGKFPLVGHVLVINFITSGPSTKVLLLGVPNGARDVITPYL